MKKLIILFVGICLFSINCLGQNNNGNVTIKKLDSKIIETFKREGKYKKIINDTLFSLTDNESYYNYVAKPVNGNFRKISIYYKKTLTLSYECNNFISMRIGIEKKYDENGNLIREANFDEGFENFTLNDFITTIKKELNIDLNKEVKDLDVGRTITKIPKYQIYIYNYKLKKVRIINVSGITRRVISDETESTNAGE